MSSSKATGLSMRTFYSGNSTQVTILNQIITNCAVGLHQIIQIFILKLKF